MRFRPRNTNVPHLDVGELLPFKVVHSGLKRVQLSLKDTRIPGEHWPKLFRLDTQVDKKVDSRRHITFEVKANSKAGSPGFTEKDTKSFWLFMTEPWTKGEICSFSHKIRSSILANSLLKLTKFRQSTGIVLKGVKHVHSAPILRVTSYKGQRLSFEPK